MIGVSSSGRRFAPLAKCLTVGKSGHEHERVAWTEGRNVPTNDPVLAGRIMQATARQNPRVSEPVYHLAISFDPRDGDKVTPALMRKVADQLLADLKLTEHQVMIVAHRDREHQHMHLMINRVHPDTGLAWDRWRDQVTVQRSLREQERALGLTEVKGRLYHLPGQEAPERPTLTSGELRQITRGEQPLMERAQARLPDFHSATTWTELHTRLAEHGLRIERKGQGLVVKDDHHEVKASRIARDISFQRLEARFGPYIDGHRALAREPDLPSRRDRIERAAEQIRTADRATHLRDEMYGAQQIAAAERAKLERLEWWEGRTRTLGGEFDRALARVYHDPVEARRQFDTHATSHGHTTAAQTLADHPDAFGRLASAPERGRFGFTSFTDTAAQTQIPTAVVAARELGTASDRLAGLVRSVSDVSVIDGNTYQRAVTHTRARAAQAEGQAERARAARAMLPSDTTIQRSISRAIGALVPAEIKQFYAMLTEPQHAIARAAVHAARNLVLGRDGPAYS